MLNELYIDPVEKEFLEHHLFDRIELDVDVYVEDISIRIYPYIAAKVESLINNISWFHDKIYLPDIIFEDTILKEQNHVFKYEILDTITYCVSSLELNGIDIHTGKYRISAYVEEKTRNNKKSQIQKLVYSYGLN